MSYHQPDHVRDALGKLLSVDKGKPLVAALHRVLVQRFQGLEDVLDAMRQKLSLDDATGYSLDRLGAIVDEPRLGRSDDLYRLWVRARGLVNRGSGTADQLLQILRLVTGSGSVLRYHDVPNRYAEVYITATNVDAQVDQVGAIMREAVPAGVRLDLSVSTVPTDETFGMAPGPGVGFGVGRFASLG